MGDADDRFGRGVSQVATPIWIAPHDGDPGRNRDAVTGSAGLCQHPYERHQPEQTLLYQLIARLAALVPKPSTSPAHGVLAPNQLVTPARARERHQVYLHAEVRTPAERHAAMTWAQRLACVQYRHRGLWHAAGSVRVIASIEDQDVIDRILTHLRQKEQETPTAIAGATDQSATWYVASFRWEGFQTNSTTNSKEASETAWHERLRALVQD
jgi:hypothetical protein